MEINWRWDGERWWVRFYAVYADDVQPRPKDIISPSEDFLWVSYDSLCEAFPGFKDLVTPL